METTLTFHLNTDDKEIIKQYAKTQRLSYSALCRIIILNHIQQKEQEEIE